jgi:glucose/arabinose dehydrogenase
MALGPPGVLFVGSRSEGKVYAVVDREGGNRKVYVLARGLNDPSGIAFRDGALYVAAVSRILRFRDVAHDLAHPPKPEVVTDAYPSDAHHGWKFIAFGPDGRLYVPVGAPCNICTPPGPLYATITRIALAGGPPEVVAHGVRNSVGFDFDPATGDLWFTDNGRDWLGDDAPPCELNVAQRAGLDFGFPYCHGNGIKDPDPQLAKLGECSKMTPPVQALGAHVAPLGVKFYTSNKFPEAYRSDVFIAEHGSWNRKEKNGYRITHVKLDGSKAVKYEPFATGFNRGDDVFGRPVDLLMLEDGSMLVSDDTSDAIYRITYAMP